MELVDLPRLLTLEQAATFLRVAPLDVRRSATAGELPIVRLDGQLLVDTRALLRELGYRPTRRGTSAWLWCILATASSAAAARRPIT